MTLSECSGCNSNKGTMSPARSAAGSDNERLCRICLDSCSTNTLVAPCKCAGSAKYAHEACLLQWFFRSKKKTCELCLSVVNVKPVGFKPLSKWRLPSEHCDFIFYLFSLYCIIMFVFTGMIMWIASQGCTSPVCITLYVICAMSMMYFVYCCGCVEYSKSYWRACLSANRIWKIYDRDDTVNTIKSKRGLAKAHLDGNSRCSKTVSVPIFTTDTSRNLSAESVGSFTNSCSSPIQNGSVSASQSRLGSPLPSWLPKGSFEERVLSSGSICILSESTLKTNDTHSIGCSDRLVQNFAINFLPSVEPASPSKSDDDQPFVYIVSIPERDYSPDCGLQIVMDTERQGPQANQKMDQ